MNLFDPIGLALMPADKQWRVLLFWYTQVVYALVAYHLLAWSGSGFPEPLGVLTIERVIGFLTSDSMVLLMLLWVATVVLIRYVSLGPLILVGFIGAHITRKHSLAIAKEFNLIIFWGDPKNGVYKGKWYRYVESFLGEEGGRTFDEEVVSSSARLWAASLGTLLLVELTDPSGALVNAAGTFLWIWCANQLFNTIAIYYIREFIKLNRRNLLKIGKSGLRDFLQRRDMTYFRYPIEYVQTSAPNSLHQLSSD